MTGVILAGGLGTRLRSEVPDTAKCLVSVNGEPFLHNLLRQFVKFGVTRIVLCTGYRAEQVQAVIGSQFEGVPVVYSQEQQSLGTAGALRLARDTYPAEGPWLVSNGDSYFDLDLIELRDGFEKSACAVGMAVARVPDGGRFGALTWTPERRVLGFEEKTGRSEPAWINAGVYILTQRFLSSLSSKSPLSLERDVLPRWISEGIFVSPMPGRFIDIGVPESYRAAQKFFVELAA